MDLELIGKWNVRPESLREVESEISFWNDFCRANVLKPGKRIASPRGNL